MNTFILVEGNSNEACNGGAVTVPNNLDVYPKTIVAAIQLFFKVIETGRTSRFSCE